MSEGSLQLNNRTHVGIKGLWSQMTGTIRGSETGCQIHLKHGQSMEAMQAMAQSEDMKRTQRSKI